MSAYDDLNAEAEALALLEAVGIPESGTYVEVWTVDDELIEIEHEIDEAARARLLRYATEGIKREMKNEQSRNAGQSGKGA